VKKYIINGFLIIIGPLLFFLIVEASLRISTGLYAGYIAYLSNDEIIQSINKRLLYGSESFIKFKASKDKPETSLPSIPKEAKTIFVVGGSTAACYGVKKGECWTNYLQELLLNQMSQNKSFPLFQVVNLGQNSGTSTNSRCNLLTALKELNGKRNIDYLIWYEGLNDVFFIAQEYTPVSNYLESYGQCAQVDTRLSSGDRLLGYLYENTITVRLGVKLKESLFTASASDGRTIKRNRAKIAAQINMINLNMVKNIAKEGTFMFSVPLPKDPMEREDHIIFEELKIFYSYLRQFCSENNIQFYDTASVIESEPPDDMFLKDRVHLNANGNQLVGQTIYQHILPHLAVDRAMLALPHK